jgi:orotate phosphoribosyltransferase
MATGDMREYLRSEIEHKGIYRVAPGGRALPGKAPNTRYTWQFYLRRCLFDPWFTICAARTLLAEMPEGKCQFAAVEDAGVPLAQALATLTETPMISVKKQRKMYGLMNWTEGRVTGEPLVLVDDLAGSQASLKAAKKVLQAFKLPVAPLYVTLVNKTQGTHAENYLGDSKLVSLFTCEDFAMSWAAYLEKYNRDPAFGPTY